MAKSQWFRGAFELRPSRFRRRWRVYELRLVDGGMRKIKLWRATFISEDDAVAFIGASKSWDEQHMEWVLSFEGAAT